MKAITVELPDEVLPRFREAPEVLGRELRLAAAVGWLRLGRISAAEAAGVASTGRAEFEAALAAGSPATGEESVPPVRPFAPEEAERRVSTRDGGLPAGDVAKAQ